MSPDFKLNLLAGGVTDCSPSWKDRIAQYDQCYKLYLPIQGAAHVADSSQRYLLKPGSLYFISGYKLISQECRVRMLVHWLHFTPASYFLQRQLQRVPCVHHWPLAKVASAKEVMEQIPSLFENAGSPDLTQNTLKRQTSYPLMCRVQAMMLQLISDLLECLGPPQDDARTRGLERLRHAIIHMDQHFVDSPPLADLAERVDMAPNAFHRLFREIMGVTPYNYMAAKRLDHGLRLLADTHHSVHDIAQACGYADPLYFSRVFKRHYGRCPSEARQVFLRIP